MYPYPHMSPYYLLTHTYGDKRGHTCIGTRAREQLACDLSLLRDAVQP